MRSQAAHRQARKDTRHRSLAPYTTTPHAYRARRFKSSRAAWKASDDARRFHVEHRCCESDARRSLDLETFRKSSDPGRALQNVGGLTTSDQGRGFRRPGAGFRPQKRWARVQAEPRSHGFQGTAGCVAQARERRALDQVLNSGSKGGTKNNRRASKPHSRVPQNKSAPRSPRNAHRRSKTHAGPPKSRDSGQIETLSPSPSERVPRRISWPQRSVVATICPGGALAAGSRWVPVQN